MTSAESIVVMGEGWAALGAVGFALQAGRNVVWVTGSGARMAAPFPTLEAGLGLRGDEAWNALCAAYGLDAGESQTGSYLREFRNKSFREPNWVHAPTPEDRASVREELLPPLERGFAPLFETRFSTDLNELEQEIRNRVMAISEGEPARLRRIENTPVHGFKVEKKKLEAVILGSGEEIPCREAIFADRWAGAQALEGLPKAMPLLRKRGPANLLQVVFTHVPPVGAGLSEGFFGTLHREPGEENDKHLWGHFSIDGKRSIWSVVVSSEEGEDNHLIAKRLRRMKGALDKMFAGSSWLPEGKTEFMSTVTSEQVRFEEGVLLTEGELLRRTEPVSGVEGLFFATDGYGPSSALHQVAQHFGNLPELTASAGSPRETESMNGPEASLS